MGSYILSSEKARYDYSFIIMPGIFSIVWLSIFSNLELPLSMIALFTFYFADGGHIFTTIWRYDRKLFSSRWELLLPFIAFFLFFALWIFYELPYLYTIVIYAAAFHNIRQSYGVSRWYQKLNHKFDSKLGNYLFYALHILPGIIFHFRDDFLLHEDYPFSSIFFFPHEGLYRIGIGIYIFSWILWIIYQVKHGNIKMTYLPVFLYPLLQAIIYGYSFLLSQDMYEMLIPLLLSHGLAYIALIEKSHRSILGTGILVPVIVTAGLGGAFYFVGQPENVELVTTFLVLKIAIMSFALASLFTHYWIDMYIWKSTNEDAKKIYSTN